MKTYEGNVVINKENQGEWEERLKDVEKITGYVDVYGSATFPVLAEVGGYVAVSGSAKAEFPVLAEVGGSVAVSGSAKAEFPKRKPTNNPKPIRNTLLKKGYLFADGILSRLVSKKKSGKVTIYRTKKIGSRDKIIFVVQKGEQFSHGETVKQAVHDLRYKLADRDTTKYQKWTLETVKPIADVIGAYRVITGACETGTKGWCEGKKLPERLSIKVAIRLTKGAWAANKFSEFFKSK